MTPITPTRLTVTPPTKSNGAVVLKAVAGYASIYAPGGTGNQLARIPWQAQLHMPSASILSAGHETGVEVFDHFQAQLFDRCTIPPRQTFWDDDDPMPSSGIHSYRIFATV